MFPVVIHMAEVLPCFDMLVHVYMYTCWCIGPFKKDNLSLALLMFI